MSFPLLPVWDIGATGEQWAADTSVRPVLLVAKAWKHKGLIHASRKLQDKVRESLARLADGVWTDAETVIAEVPVLT